MKLLVETSTKLAKVVATADQSPHFNDDGFFQWTTDLGIMIAGDCTDDNCDLIDIDSAPDDFIGCKYLYDAAQTDPFVLNADWVDPTAPEEPAE